MPKQLFIPKKVENELNWIVTNTFELTEDAEVWSFEDFTEATKKAHDLTGEYGSLWIWRLTNGNPIKWMEVKA